MGTSDVIPGVSGGTMAFILGIYEELINAIKSFDYRALRLLLIFDLKGFLRKVHWEFLIAVCSGILIAILSLAKVLTWLLKNEPVLIWSFFFGLILASVYTVSKRIKGWTPYIFLACAGGTIFAYWLVGLIPAKTPNAPWYLFISGAIAICAMILPGISGSFILVLLGKYEYILHALNAHDVATLSIVAAGACLGITMFSRLLGWLFSRHHDLAVAILTGFMLGSLRKVWPWKKSFGHVLDAPREMANYIQMNTLPRQFDSRVLAAICLMLAGCICVILLDRAASTKP